MKKTLLFLACCVPFLVSSAQEQQGRMRDRIESALRTNYEKVNYDTLYLTRPDSKLTLKVRGNLSGTTIKGKDKAEGGTIKSDFKTSTRGTVSIGASYLGISAAVAVNPGRLSGKNKDMEYNINAYGNRFGLEASYQDSKTLSGDVRQGEKTYNLEKGDVRYTMLTITGYYAFNHKRFSYPAAFTQSYIQKRSAGSWLVGATFQSGRIKNTKDAPAALQDTRLAMTSFAIGGGYGYNFVVKKFLFHASTQPCLIVYDHNSIRVGGKKEKTGTYFPEMIINTRAAIIYNFNQRYFAGTTFLFNTTTLGNRNHYTDILKWRARAFVGVRL